MQELLICIYIFVNIAIIIWCIARYDLAAFTPPFIASAISLTVILPQLTTIYFQPMYDNDLLYNLCYTMITCNLAFVVGYDWGIKVNLPRRIIDVDIERCRLMTLLFSIIGLYSLFTTGDGVIIALFRSFSQISIILSCVYFLKVRRFSFVVFSALVLSMLNVLNFIFFIYGSRGSSLFLFICIMYTLSLALKKYRSKLNLIMMTFLLAGSIVSSSIADFRNNLIKGDDVEIDFIENFKAGYIDSSSAVGMDLGNAALLIDYSSSNGVYNYGMIVWNGFVYNYVPARFVGESVKSNLTYKTSYDKLIPEITNGITTVTGYFEAFAAWGYVGFLLFGIIGYLFGVIWTRSKYSMLYLILLLYSLGNVPLMITHNLQYILSRWEFLIIFIMPLLYFAICFRTRRVISDNV